MDNPFVSCPYEPKHRVLRSRIQAHIIKCEKKYPELAICPFNFSHRYPASEMKQHVANCPAMLEMSPKSVPATAGGHLTRPKPILQRDYLPETDPNHEDWDK